MQVSQSVVSVDRFQVFVEHFKSDSSKPSVILVNGALATIASFRQMARSLTDHFNVLLYDLPHSGQSREHNAKLGLLSKDDEVAVLLGLIEQFCIHHVVSVSWGGVANLLALGKRPSGVRSAVVGSFSPTLNGPMRDYVDGARVLIDAKQYSKAAHLLNDTVGKHLPRLLKLYNYRYLTRIEEPEMTQIRFHVDQILGLDIASHRERLKAIEVPVLFINGELDAYTPASDVRAMTGFLRDCAFVTIPGAGHFLEVENRAASIRVQQTVLEFLRHGRSEPSSAGARIPG